MSRGRTTKTSATALEPAKATALEPAKATALEPAKAKALEPAKAKQKSLETSILLRNRGNIPRSSQEFAVSNFLAAARRTRQLFQAVS